MPGRCDLRRGSGQHGGAPLLGGGEVRQGVSDQLSALHHVRPVRGGLPHPSSHADQQLRDGLRDSRGRHLREMAAPGAAAATGHRAGDRTGALMADWIVFWVMAPISVAAGVAMVLARNAVHSALLLIVNFFTLAVFFLILGSPFLFV